MPIVLPLETQNIFHCSIRCLPRPAARQMMVSVQTLLQMLAHRPSRRSSVLLLYRTENFTMLALDTTNVRQTFLRIGI